ncbi:MAG: helix-turn-helix domain-containing protein [Deltaproteobacteria bacterium]|nr:helix-turn-helix domain-containing protein [Deltaproteobacteria bacterium]
MTPGSGTVVDARSALALWLRDGRARKKLSLDDVARITKIQPRILEKLESGQLEGLPAEVFVRGFVRSFARCVGLDESEALDRYTQCREQPAAPSMARALVETMQELAPVTARVVIADKPIEVVEVIEVAPPVVLAETPVVVAETPVVEAPAPVVVEAASVETAPVAEAAPAIETVPLVEAAPVEAAPPAKKKRSRKKLATGTPSDGMQTVATTPAAPKRSRKKKATPVEAAPVVETPLVEAAPVETPVVETAAVETTIAQEPFEASVEHIIEMSVDEPGGMPVSTIEFALVDAELAVEGSGPTHGTWRPTMPPLPTTSSMPWRRPALPATTTSAPTLVIDDADPDRAEREQDERNAARDHRVSFLPPILLDREDKSARQGGLTLAVIILLIAATLTLSYLMRRPSVSGNGVTMNETRAIPAATLA